MDFISVFVWLLVTSKGMILHFGLKHDKKVFALYLLKYWFGSLNLIHSDALLPR